jgi:hypothetical protein
MRFYPRNTKSRQDALMGRSHLGNHSTGDYEQAQSRLQRYRPDIDTTAMVNSTLATYGGSSTANP